MIAEPSSGIFTTQIGLDTHCTGELIHHRELAGEGSCSRKDSYESSIDVDEDDELEYLDEDEDDAPETDVDTRTEGGGISPMKGIPIIKTSLSSNRQSSKDSLSSSCYVGDRARLKENWK